MKIIFFMISMGQDSDGLVTLGGFEGLSFRRNAAMVDEIKDMKKKNRSALIAE